MGTRRARPAEARTEYARSRPVRERTKSSRLQPLLQSVLPCVVAAADEEQVGGGALCMVPCARYTQRERDPPVEGEAEAECFLFCCRSGAADEEAPPRVDAAQPFNLQVGDTSAA